MWLLREDTGPVDPLGGSLASPCFLVTSCQSPSRWRAVLYQISYDWAGHL
jgi:hypothetical protein